MSKYKPRTFVEILQERAALDEKQPLAYTFHESGDDVRKDLTYKELERRAKCIAGALGEGHPTGSRALLLYGSEREFISGFFGCLYAGVIAVPAYPPHPLLMDRMLPRILTIIRDSGADVVLTDSASFSVMRGVREMAPELQKLKWIQTDLASMNSYSSWNGALPGLDQTALIQYTSGSTGTPKGVMISQENLSHNCSLLCRCVNVTSADKGVSWTPVYHDMGLIFGMLNPIYGGFPMTIISPIDFLKRPYRWLKAISDTQASITCAPNFAYELCARKITDEELSTLNLSSLTVASVSAEPVRSEMLTRFTARFAACGFKPESFYPAYGMAESTLVISAAGTRSTLPKLIDLSTKSLEQNKLVKMPAHPYETRRFVGSGKALGEMTIFIVDPVSKQKIDSGKIGEIWIKGPSVAQGYWQRPEETEKEFQAFISNSEEGPFLRTGDLGFCDETGEIFITGRMKDLIILHGKNHYPQDIEATVERAGTAVRAGCVAAFEITADGEAKVVVVAEVERRKKIPHPKSAIGYMAQKALSVIPMFDPNYPIDFNKEETVQAIRQALSQSNRIQIYAIVLIKAGSISKTSSGKIQRRSCKEAYLNKKLQLVFEWHEGHSQEKAA